MTAAVLGGAVSQWPLGHLSDRIDRRYVMGMISLGGMLIAIVTWLFVDRISPLLIVLLCGAWGAMAFPLNAISVAHANDNADSDEYVMLSSGLLLMYGIGAIFGPLASSVAMSIVGAGGLFLFTALVHGVLLLYLLNRTLRRSAPDTKHHVPFDDAMAASHTTSQVFEESID
jgi:MFS family permease